MPRRETERSIGTHSKQHYTLNNKQLQTLFYNHGTGIYLLPGIEPKRPIVIAGPQRRDGRAGDANSQRTCSQRHQKSIVPASGSRAPNPEDSKAWANRDSHGSRSTGNGHVCHHRSGHGQTRGVSPENGPRHAVDRCTHLRQPFAMQEIADALRGTDIPYWSKTLSIRTLNCGSAAWNGSTTRASADWLLSIRGFSSYEKKSTATSPMAHPHRSCAAASLNCPSSVIQATSAASANSSLLSANKQWTWASMGLSSRATAVRTRLGATRHNR